jgi:SAM-dependent methyltransferase
MSGGFAQRWLDSGYSTWFPRAFELYFRHVRSGVGTRGAEQSAIITALAPCLNQGQRVLDLGSGTGHYTAMLLEEGARVWARDASTAMISYLRKRLRTTAVGDLDVGFGRFPDDLRIDGTFDGVLTVGMINYIADLHGTFAVLAKLLKPGGWVVFNVPRADGNGRRYAMVELLGRRQVYLRSSEEVEDAVAAAGLRLTHGPVKAGVTAVYRCEAPPSP